MPETCDEVYGRMARVRYEKFGLDSSGIHFGPDGTVSLDDSIDKAVWECCLDDVKCGKTDFEY